MCERSYVQVEMHGVYGDAQVRRTEVVNDNGFNPTFNGGKGEQFIFDIQEREVAILKFLVRRPSAPSLRQSAAFLAPGGAAVRAFAADARRGGPCSAEGHAAE